MFNKKIAFWRIILVFLLIVYLIFSVVNFSITGVSSYFTSLFFFSILGIVSFKDLRKLALTFIILFVVELGLIFFSPYKSYSERNGSHDFVAPYFSNPKPSPYPAGTIQYDLTPEFNFMHHYNNLGFKDVYASEKNYHAFILGDSFAQGVGTDSTNSIDKILEDNLNCDNCILNLGLSGSELANNLYLLKQLNQSGYHSKYIILNFNATDLNDLIFDVKKIPELKKYGPSLVFQYVYGISYLFRHLCHDLFGYNWNLLIKKDEETLKPKIVDLIYNYFVEFEEYSKNSNSQFILVFQPLLDECQNKTYLSKTLIERLNNENPAIKYVDLSYLFEDDCSAYYWPRDMHFNTAGYQKFSNELYEQISIIDSSFTK